MARQYRVHTHSFADDEHVVVQLQAIGHNGSYSATWTKEEAAAYPVGSVVELDLKPVKQK